MSLQLKVASILPKGRLHIKHLWIQQLALAIPYNMIVPPWEQNWLTISDKRSLFLEVQTLDPENGGSTIQNRHQGRLKQSNLQPGQSYTWVPCIIIKNYITKWLKLIFDGWQSQHMGLSENGVPPKSIGSFFSFQNWTFFGHTQFSDTHTYTVYQIVGWMNN